MKLYDTDAIIREILGRFTKVKWNFATRSVTWIKKKQEY